MNMNELTWCKEYLSRLETEPELVITEHTDELKREIENNENDIVQQNILLDRLEKEGDEYVKEELVRIRYHIERVPNKTIPLKQNNKTMYSCLRERENLLETKPEAFLTGEIFRVGEMIDRITGIKNDLTQTLEGINTDPDGYINTEITKTEKRIAELEG